MMGTTDADLTWVLESDGKLTITGAGAMSYDIPWKAYNSQITEIVIGEGVTSISSSAFSECFNLTSVSLPSTLKYIYDSAFYRCLKLESVQIPASVTNIYSGAFEACTAMTGIWVAEDNANYSSDASGVLYNKEKTELIFCPRGFAGSYEIPSGVTAIKSSAFNGCSGLTDITIADTVTTIENYAFNSCAALADITIPASVAAIGSNAFAYCDGFTAITIPGTVVSLGDHVFAYCEGLTSVTFEDGLVSLGTYAFSHCTALTDVKLPDTLVSISYECFWNCKITSITIPGKVSYIDKWAFESCPLTEIRFTGNAPMIESGAFTKNYNIDAITAYYPAGDDTWTEEIFNGSYGATFNWVPYEKDAGEEDEELTTVASGTCGDNLSWVLMSNGALTITGTGTMSYDIPWKAYNSQITEIVIGEGVTSISSSAFSECFNLTSVSLPSTLKYIYDSAFYRCLKLESVQIPASVTNIYSGAFEACTAMTGIWVAEDNANYSSDASGVLYNKEKTELIFCPRGFAGSYEIPSGVTAIKSSAFNGCSGLTDITIADTVTTIENYAFNSCAALADITIPASVAAIGSNAFAYCDGFTAITIPGTVVSLGDHVFAYCEGLTSVTFEDGLVSLGTYAFSHCTALTDVKLPDTLVSISYECFWNCKITSITIPGKVSYIDKWAFESCPLTEIRFTGNAPMIESGAFTKNYNIDAITAYYPAGDDTWTEEIFNGSYGATFDWVSYEPSLPPEDDAPAYIVAQGSCGVNVSWMIMSDGRLVIYGNGSMQFVMRSGAAPWSAYADQITSIVITTGVDSIADNAFVDCANVTTVSVAETVTSVGAEAFAGCENLETVTFAGDAPEIGENCFENVEAVIEYPVDNDTWTQEIQENFGGNMTWEPIEHIHSYDTTRQDATCVKTGSVTMKCECGETEARTLAIDPENHTGKNTVTGKVDATCGAEGYTGDTVCECGVTIESGEKIPVAGEHSWEDATCTNPKTCSVCKETKGKPVGHKYDDNVDGTCNSCDVNRETVEIRQVTHMLRMYNPYTGEHFYTGSEEERDNLVAVGWNYEGVAFTFPGNTGAPVYRLYDPATGEHLYTMDEEEKATLEAAGWNYEGIAFNSAYDTEAVQHRLHNPYATVGAYHFTFSEEEMNNLIAAGWEYQGIGWYSCWK